MRVRDLPPFFLGDFVNEARPELDDSYLPGLAPPISFLSSPEERLHSRSLVVRIPRDDDPDQLLPCPRLNPVRFKNEPPIVLASGSTRDTRSLES